MQTKSEMINRIAELAKENAELKAELQKFKDMAKKGLDEFKDVGGCWGCGLQLQLNQDMEDIKQLKAENEKLKHSNENLRLALKTYEMPEVVKVLTDWRTGELDLRMNRYKQTLQEIKKIAEEHINTRMLLSDKKSFFEFNNIYKLITKAEEE